MARHYLENESDVVFYHGQAVDAMQKTCDLCIVDLYCYEQQYYKQLAYRCHSIAIFDDNRFFAPGHVQAVINTNISVTKESYDDSLKTFVGPDFALIKSAPVHYAWDASSQRCFVCSGGSDPERQTVKWVKSILRTTNFNIDVVTGPGFEWNEDLIWLDNTTRVLCHRNPDSLMRIACQARFSLISSGTLLYEMAVTGVPSICIALADNQRPVAESFADKQAAYYVGYINEISDMNIDHAICLFSEQSEFIKAISDNAKKLITPNGQRRLAEAILNWLENKS